MSNPKTEAKNIQLILKDLGHEIPLGHAYELIAKMEGFKSWNVASSKQTVSNLVGELSGKINKLAEQEMKGTFFERTPRTISDKAFKNKLEFASQGFTPTVPGAVAFLGDGKNTYQVKLVTQAAEAKIYVEVRANSEAEVQKEVKKFIDELDASHSRIGLSDWEVIYLNEEPEIQDIYKIGVDYSIIVNQPEEPLLIKDNDNGKTITNGAESVVEELMEKGILPVGRRLFYIDTMGYQDEIVRDPVTGLFKGFQPTEKRDEFKQLNLIAKRLFNDHYDHEKPDPENCGSCALLTGDKDGPNYAGWARIYVEARRAIPGKWKKAFESERKSDNKAYAQALERSIAYFGVTFNNDSSRDRGRYEVLLWQDDGKNGSTGLENFGEYLNSEIAAIKYCDIMNQQILEKPDWRTEKKFYSVTDKLFKESVYCTTWAEFLEIYKK